MSASTREADTVDFRAGSWSNPTAAEASPFRPAEVVLSQVVDQDARAAVLDRLGVVFLSLQTGGRLDIAADDLMWCADRLTAVVDQQLETGVRILDVRFELGAAA